MSRKAPARRPAADAAPVKTLQMPACCAKCQGDKFEPINEGKKVERQIVGRMQGFDFESATWENKRCAKCGQVWTIRTYYATSHQGP